MLRARLALVALLVAWLFSPPEWRYAVPLWLPFALALALELQFFVTGLVSPSERTDRGRGPQQADLQEFGWEGEPPEEHDPEFWTSPAVPRRRRRGAARLLGPALVLAAVGLIVWGVSVRRGWSALDSSTQAQVEHVITAEARKIAGHPVTVVCDTSGHHVGAVQEADGLAEVGGSRAWLTPGICYQLSRVIEGHDPHPGRGTGHAIVVLAHESWHLRGVADEGLANCYAYQSGVQVGTNLGLERGVAYELMKQAYSDNAVDAAEPQYVVPAGCTAGGKYDLNPASAQFP
ncbi:MAG TPA: hypothetical protein VF094_11180 [Gaiellaceae bacterium]